MIRCPSNLSVTNVRGKPMCCPKTGTDILSRCVDPVSLRRETRMFGGVGGLDETAQRYGEGTCQGTNCNDRNTDVLRSIGGR